MAVTESTAAATAGDGPDATGSSVSTGQKRSSTTAGNSSGGFRPVKRRASKACQCCRARKVRCNVVEHGAPCTNCRLDEVECIITESKRRKKLWGTKVDSAGSASDTASAPKPPTAAASQKSPSASHHHEPHVHSPSAISVDGNSDRENSGHVPHMIYQAQSLRMGLNGERERRASYASSHGSVPSLTNSFSTQTSMTSTAPHRVSRPLAIGALPEFIKPTPTRIPPEDLEYLAKKGALTLPSEPLRSELLNSHFNFVHPYMPLLNKKEFLDSVTSEDESKGKTSLLLFQAVMFSGSAFVDMESLRMAGFATRKAARKAFFTKVRALYDFDHEQDRMSLVQTLLLMTYWYETPDDQKDTWHWMGVAISLCHTIGLHRNPENSNMDPKRKKLWKRIWWSCFMRDRLVALGMRRPTRIKCEDCDVPMLTLDDFLIDNAVEEEGEDSVFWSYEERQRKEKEAKRQRELAIMCIEKAKLCVCISQVLSAQYSVLNTNQGSLAADGSTRTTMMLLPKKLDPECCQVVRCDEELAKWAEELPEEARYAPGRANESGDDVLTLHRNLLHMVYYTTVSALHRPQVLPSAPAPWPAKNNAVELQEVSRRKVRQAASEITRMAEELIEFDLVRYLPTTGVTVMLPAVIIHLLDIKSSNVVTRELSLEGFSLCMQVMQGLRQSYSAADYATHFLEAAIKKADIQVHGYRKFGHRRRARHRNVAQLSASSLGSTAAISIPASASPSNAALTPPPDLEGISVPGSLSVGKSLDENELQFKLESFLQAPPSPSHDAPLPSAFNIGSNGHSTLQAPALAGADDLLFSDSTPHLSMPTDGDNGDLDALLMRVGDNQQNDPFLGHYEDSMSGKNGGFGGRAFDLMGESSSWLEEDMSRLLDGVDFDIDDVIQVLETEIN